MPCSATYSTLPSRSTTLHAWSFHFISFFFFQTKDLEMGLSTKIVARLKSEAYGLTDHYTKLTVTWHATRLLLGHCRLSFLFIFCLCEVC
jgi:hypothetical protein